MSRPLRGEVAGQVGAGALRVAVDDVGAPADQRAAVDQGGKVPEVALHVAVAEVEQQGVGGWIALGPLGVDLDHLGAQAPPGKTGASGGSRRARRRRRRPPGRCSTSPLARCTRAPSGSSSTARTSASSRRAIPRATARRASA